MRDNELYHYGVKGMKWGVRRYRNKDGSLTSAGKRRKDSGYSDAEAKVYSAKQARKTAKKEYSKAYNKAYNKSLSAYSPSKKHRESNDKRWKEAFDKADSYNKANDSYKRAKKNLKKTANQPNKDYSKSSRQTDQEVFGRKFVERKNRNMNKGYSELSAQAMASGRLLVDSLAVGTATTVAIGGALYLLGARR